MRAFSFLAACATSASSSSSSPPISASDPNSGDKFEVLAEGDFSNLDSTVVRQLQTSGSNSRRKTLDAVFSEKKSRLSPDKREGRGLIELSNGAFFAHEELETLTFADGSSLTLPSNSAHSHARNLTRDSFRNVKHVKGAHHLTKSGSHHRRLAASDWDPKHFKATSVSSETKKSHKSSLVLAASFGGVPSHSSKRRHLATGGGAVAFTTLPYRHPQQCERKSCLDPQAADCKRHLDGFYLYERGCPLASDTREQSCTACQYATALDAPTICQCEKKLFTRPSRYNEPCDSSRECVEGQCFRPCEFFMHLTTCPMERCMWNTTSEACVSLPDALVYTEWTTLADASGSGNETSRGEAILSGVAKSIFPLGYAELERVTDGYQISGYDLVSLISVVELFQKMDQNLDGSITHLEFNSGLPGALHFLEAKAARRTEVLLAATQTTSNTVAGRRALSAAESEQELYDAMDAELQEDDPIAAAEAGFPKFKDELRFAGRGSESRELQIGGLGNLAAHQQQAVSAEDCVSQSPPKFYCSIAMSCMDACSGCGWKTVENREMFACNAPSPSSCTSVGKYYCGTDDACHDHCSSCTGRTILDASQKTCLSPWWYTTPSADMSTKNLINEKSEFLICFSITQKNFFFAFCFQIAGFAESG